MKGTERMGDRKIFGFICWVLSTCPPLKHGSHALRVSGFDYARRRAFNVQGTKDR